LLLYRASLVLNFHTDNKRQISDYLTRYIYDFLGQSVTGYFHASRIIFISYGPTIFIVLRISNDDQWYSRSGIEYLSICQWRWWWGCKWWSIKLISSEGYPNLIYRQRSRYYLSEFAINVYWIALLEWKMSCLWVIPMEKKTHTCTFISIWSIFSILNLFLYVHKHLKNEIYNLTMHAVT